MYFIYPSNNNNNNNNSNKISNTYPYFECLILQIIQGKLTGIYIEIIDYN
jgi:hypothetical protein